MAENSGPFAPRRPAGLEIRNAHFPGRAPIDAYGNGGFRFAGMSHRGSLMCLPSGIYGWNVESPADFSEAAFARVVGEAAMIEVLLLGGGPDLVPLPKDLREQLSGAGVRVEPMNTGAAVRTYNVLMAEERAVAAAMIAV